MTSKSPQLSTSELKYYSKLMVLQSAAGYYIGSLYQEDPNEPSPGTRDSQYFRTEAEAIAAFNSNDWMQVL